MNQSRPSARRAHLDRAALVQMMLVFGGGLVISTLAVVLSKSPPSAGTLYGNVSSATKKVRIVQCDYLCTCFMLLLFGLFHALLLPSFIAGIVMFAAPNNIYVPIYS